VEQAIAGRRSVRRFTPDPIASADLAALVAAAGQAPSAHNRQPWRLRILRDPAEKLALAQAMGTRLAADRGRDGDDRAAIAQDVARSSQRITGAPVVIVVCLTLDDMDRYPDDRRNRAEYLMAVQSTAMASQNLLLAAQDRGLGACWVCAPLFCPGAVGETLGLPESWQPQGLILLGRPAEPGRVRGRKPACEIAIGLC
jgi:F420 biosynthesis protein FbiB-like protein